MATGQWKSWADVPDRLKTEMRNNSTASDGTAAGEGNSWGRYVVPGMAEPTWNPYGTSSEKVVGGFENDGNTYVDPRYTPAGDPSNYADDAGFDDYWQLVRHEDGSFDEVEGESDSDMFDSLLSTAAIQAAIVFGGPMVLEGLGVGGAAGAEGLASLGAAELSPLVATNVGSFGGVAGVTAGEVAAAGAAGAGGIASLGTAGTGSGAFLGEGVASGVGAWDAAATAAGLELTAPAVAAAGTGLGTGSGAFVGEGVTSGVPAWDAAAKAAGLSLTTPGVVEALKAGKSAKDIADLIRGGGSVLGLLNEVFGDNNSRSGGGGSGDKPQGWSKPLTMKPATRTQLHPNAYAEGGGVSAPELRSQSFVLPADVVAGLGNGNSESGAAVLARIFGEGAQYLAGDTDGMADKLATRIDGQQEAALSHGEVIISPEKVMEIGEGNPKSGAARLRKLMADVRKQRTGTTKQGKEVDARGILSAAVGGSVKAYAGGGIVSLAEGGLIVNMPRQSPQYMVATLLNQGKTPEEIIELTGYNPQLVLDYVQKVADGKSGEDTTTAYGASSGGAFSNPYRYDGELSPTPESFLTTDKNNSTINGYHWSMAAQTYLGRALTPAETTSWQAKVDSGELTGSGVFDAIALSDESKQKQAGTWAGAQTQSGFTADWNSPSRVAPPVVVGQTVVNGPPGTNTTPPATNTGPVIEEAPARTRAPLQPNADGRRPGEYGQHYFSDTAETAPTNMNGRTPEQIADRTGIRRGDTPVTRATFDDGGWVNPDAGGPVVPPPAGTPVVPPPAGTPVVPPPAGTPVVPPPAGTVETANNSNLAPWAAPYVDDMLSTAWGAAMAPTEVYTGPLTAGASTLQGYAFQDAANLQTPGGFQDASDIASNVAGAAAGTTYNPGTFTNQSVGTGAFDAAAARQYMDPYMQGVVALEQQDAQRQADIAATRRSSQGVQRGAYGGGRQAIMDAEASRNLAEQQGGIQTRGLSTAYQRAMEQFNADQSRSLTAQTTNQTADANRQTQDEQSRQFSTTVGLRGLDTQLAAAGVLNNSATGENTAGLANLQALLNAGGVQRGIDAEGIAADQLQWSQQEKAQRDRLTWMNSMLNGVPITLPEQGGQNNPNNPSTTDQIVGGAGAIAALWEQWKNANP